MAMMRTMALPTMAPSEGAATCAACSGVLTPKPTAAGISDASRTSFIMAERSVVISFRMPVTPMEETRYKNPSASAAMVRIRSSEVGATSEIRFTAFFREKGVTSPFSSKGRSGMMTPSTPASAQRAKNFS